MPWWVKAVTLLCSVLVLTGTGLGWVTLRHLSSGLTASGALAGVHTRGTVR